MDTRTETKVNIIARLLLALVIAGVTVLAVIDTEPGRPIPSAHKNLTQIQDQRQIIGTLDGGSSMIEHLPAGAAIHKIAYSISRHPTHTLPTMFATVHTKSVTTVRLADRIGSLFFTRSALAVLFGELVIVISCISGVRLAFSKKRSRILTGMVLILVGFISHLWILSQLTEQ